jgi:hypothetical protein
MMLKKALLLLGCGMTLQLGQCVADFIEDIVVFNAVN